MLFLETAVLLLAATALTGQSDPAREFEAAMHREIVNGDVAGALGAYRAIAAGTGTPRAIAARALLQMGQCQEKLGQRKDAHATYARIVRDFASEGEVASQARTRLEGWTDALPGPRNLRFEEGELGKVPPGWFVTEVGKTTGLAELHRKGCQSEGGCTVLLAPATAPGLVGNMMQSFSAAAYRGKTVRLRGWLRVEAGAPDDRAQMWLRVSRPNGRPGSYYNTDERPVRSPEWTATEIVAEIDRDAQFLDFGVTAIGRGRVWVDDVSFEIVPEEQITAARNAIRRQYASDTSITAFRFTGSEATATVRTATVREGFAFIETFRDTWARTGEGWRRAERVQASSAFEAPDPDGETVKAVAAEVRRYAIAIDAVGPPVSANCFALHRAEMAAGTAESVLSMAGLPVFFLDVSAAPADSALRRWLAEPHLLGGRPAILGKSCTGIVFVEGAL